MSFLHTFRGLVDHLDSLLLHENTSSAKERCRRLVAFSHRNRVLLHRARLHVHPRKQTSETAALLIKESGFENVDVRHHLKPGVRFGLTPRNPQQYQTW